MCDEGKSAEKKTLRKSKNRTSEQLQKIYFVEVIECEVKANSQVTNDGINEFIRLPRINSVFQLECDRDFVCQ